MPRPALQICYHDHCFDGVASAATFLRFYRDEVKPGLPLDRVALRGMAHRAGKLFDEEAFAGEENAVVDFRFTPDPRLTWWFDHHQSAFESEADERAFRAEAKQADDRSRGLAAEADDRSRGLPAEADDRSRGLPAEAGDRSRGLPAEAGGGTGGKLGRPPDQIRRKFWDPAAKSCTRFLAHICRDRFAWDPSPLSELIEWAEVIDGAQFADAQSAVELTHPALELMLLIEASKDPGLCPRLIRELSQRPLGEVLKESYVTEPLGPVLARHREIVRTVRERLRVEGGVAELDLSDLALDNVNKFIAYAANPATVYTVTLTRGTNRSKVSLGSNPWRQDLRKHNLARIAERYGGGGHPAVSAMSFAPDEIAKAREAARTIAAELRG